MQVHLHPRQLALVSLVSLVFSGPVACTQGSTPPSPPVAADAAPTCARASETFSPDGVILGPQSTACGAPGACASEVLVVHQGCAVSSWRPAQSDAVIISLSTAASFSPPMQAVIWAREADAGLGIDALVREGNELIRVDGVELPAPTHDEVTSCNWTFSLPSDPDGHENRITAIERCESWTPSAPGEPTFAPMEWDRRLTFVWDGSSLEQEGEP